MSIGINLIRVIPINLGTIAASGSAESDVIDLAKVANTHKYSLQYVCTGDGTVTLSWRSSNDGINFPAPASNTIQAGVVSTGGPGADGSYACDTFAPQPSRFIKIRGDETGGADSATIVAYLAIQ